MAQMLSRWMLVSLAMIGSACTRAENTAFTPTEVIDLGATVTEDLPQRFWGRELLRQRNYTKPNSVELIRWEFPVNDEKVSGSNAYYTLFNHGGPHVDAPVHMGVGAGIDTYPVQSFFGPLKVFDVSPYAPGRSVPLAVFRGQVAPGDVVLTFTRFQTPGEGALPDVRTLTHEAAEYLATLPVRAYGTDAFSVEALSDLTMPWIHHTFLARGIPVYEQLVNVDRLLDKKRLFFVGVPLNMKDGDGMLVRPIVFVY